MASITIHAECESRNGFVPAVIRWVGNVNAKDEYDALLLSLNDNFSLPVNEGRPGCVMVPNGAEGYNLMLLKTDGSWKVEDYGHDLSTSRSFTVDLDPSTYKVLPSNGNCLIYHIFDKSESDYIEDYHMTDALAVMPKYGIKSGWYIFERPGHHVIITDGTSGTITGTNILNNIPSLSGHQINEYDVNVREVKLQPTLGLPYTLKYETKFGTFTQGPTAGNRTIYLSANVFKVTAHVDSDAYVSDTLYDKVMQYSGTDTIYEWNPPRKPVLTIKTTNTDYQLLTGSNGTAVTLPTSYTCEVNETKTIYVKRMSTGDVKSFTIVMGNTDKEVDLASYGDSFRNPSPSSDTGVSELPTPLKVLLPIGAVLLLGIIIVLMQNRS